MWESQAFNFLSPYIGPFVRMPCTNYYCISSALIQFRQTTHKIHRRQTVAAAVDAYRCVSKTLTRCCRLIDDDVERIWAKRRKTESLDGKFGVVCWVYLSFIEHFIVTKPSLRRSNLIQFDSFHTCTRESTRTHPMANSNSSNNKSS